MYILSSNSLVAGRYLLKRPIGGGGMGAVWLAEHVELRAPCALKLIEGEAARNPEFRRRFTREARAAALLRSPHVVQVLDSGEWRGQPYLVMELLEGEDLRECLLRTSRLPPSDCVEIARQIARALTKAHGAEIVHRDLKPANIFLSRDDDRLVVKVLDFGIAKYADADLESTTDTGAVLGTPHYMSPEQCRGAGQVDYRSDLWSLAVIVFECLTGTRPFPGPHLVNLVHQISVGDLPLPSAVRRELPASIDAWWLRAVQRNPAERFSNAREMVEALGRALDLPTMPASSADPASSVAGSRRRAVSSVPPLLEATLPQLRPRSGSPWLQTLKGTGSLPPPAPVEEAPLAVAPAPVRASAADLPTKASGIRFANGEPATRPSAKLALAPSEPAPRISMPSGENITPPGHTTSAGSLTRTDNKRPVARGAESMRSLGLIAIGAAGLFAFGSTISRLVPSQVSVGGALPSMTSAPLLSGGLTPFGRTANAPPVAQADVAPQVAENEAAPTAAPIDAPPVAQASKAPSVAPIDAPPVAQANTAPLASSVNVARPVLVPPRAPKFRLAAPLASSAAGVRGAASVSSAPKGRSAAPELRQTLRNDEPESLQRL